MDIGIQEDLVICRGGPGILSFLPQEVGMDNGFSTTAIGTTYSPKNPYSPEIRRRREFVLYSLFGEDSRNAVRISAQHGDTVAIVGKESRGKAIPCDGLITITEGLPLYLLPGDCFPILIRGVDGKGRIFVGLIHAGYEGSKNQVLLKAIRKARFDLGANPRKIKMIIGPGINSCCFTLHPERYEEAKGNPATSGFILEANPPRLDLLSMNIMQAREAGVLNQNIYIFGACTCCSRTSSGNHLFYSHRRFVLNGKEEKEEGRFLAAVMI